MKPRPYRVAQGGVGGCRPLIGAASCLSELIPDAVGGRRGENYKVISLRFARQLTGQNEARAVISLRTDGGMMMMMMIAGSKSKDESRLV